MAIAQEDESPLLAAATTGPAMSGAYYDPIVMSSVKSPCQAHTVAAECYIHVATVAKVPPPQVLPADTSSAASSLLPPALVGFFTVFMTAAGSTFMGMPYTFVLAPVYIVLPCMVLVAAAMGFTAELVTVVYLQTRLRSYPALAHAAGGNALATALKVFIVLALTGACVASVKVVVDLSPEVVRVLGLDASVPVARAAVLVAFVGIVVPLNLVKNVSSLEYANYVGALATVVLVGVVTFRAMDVVPSNQSAIATAGSHPPMSLWTAIPQAISTYNYGFSCVYNVLPVFLTLLEKASTTATKQTPSDEVATKATMTKVIVANACGLTGMYSLFGLMTLRLYGADNVLGDVLLNLSQDSLMVLPRMAVLLAVVYSFPLLYQPMFLMAEALVVGTGAPDSRDGDLVQLPPKARVALSATMLLGIVLVGVLVPGIQAIFALCGGVFVTFNSYLFPIVLYLRLAPSPTPLRRFLCLAIAVCSIAAGAISTFHVLYGHA